MKKFKFFTILAVICVTVSAVVGGTLAYFTDDKAMTSVFTAGNVYIELSEAAVKDDGHGNLVKDTEKPRIVGGALAENTEHNYGTVFPGQSIYKDPTIKNTGTSAAWVAAKVIITDGNGDIYNVLGDGGNKIDIKLLLFGGALEEAATVETWHGISGVHVSDHYAFLQTADRALGRYVFYFFMEQEMAVNGSATLFTSLEMHESCTNEMLAEFVDFRITVQAFAVQTFGFDSCYDAMTTAFGSHFQDVKNLVPSV